MQMLGRGSTADLKIISTACRPHRKEILPSLSADRSQIQECNNDSDCLLRVKLRVCVCEDAHVTLP